MFCRPPQRSIVPLTLAFAARRVGFRRQIHQLLDKGRILTEEQAVGNKRLHGGHGATIFG